MRSTRYLYPELRAAQRKGPGGAPAPRRPIILFAQSALTLLIMGAFMAPVAYVAADFVRRFRAGV